MISRLAACVRTHARPRHPPTLQVVRKVEKRSKARASFYDPMVAVQAHDELETLNKKLSLVNDMRAGEIKDSLLAKLESKIAAIINRDESSESEADVLPATAPAPAPAHAPAPAPAHAPAPAPAAALGAPPHALLHAGADLPPLLDGEQALRDDDQLSGSGFSLAGDDAFSLHGHEQLGLGYEPGNDDVVENDSGDSVA